MGGIMTRTASSLAIAIGLLVAHGLAVAQQAPEPRGTIKASVEAPVSVTPDRLNWGPAPAVLPPGAQAAMLDGDPAVPDRLFSVRFRMPAGYRIMPHWHPADEHVTIISGEVRIGHGEKFDRRRMQTLGTGGYFVMPARHTHFIETTADTVLQLHGVGPWQLIYVNPADDPRREQRAPETARAR
jgi:quercetin dioxygenase-like cupin family protein